MESRGQLQSVSKLTNSGKVGKQKRSRTVSRRVGKSQVATSRKSASKTSGKIQGIRKASVSSSVKAEPDRHASTSSVGNRRITDYFCAVRRSERRNAKQVEQDRLSNLDVLVHAYATREPQSFEVIACGERGRGVAAARSFSKGEFVVEYAGELVDEDEARRREILYSQDSSVGCYVYHFVSDSRKWCVDATAETVRLGRLINHSRKEANLVTRCVQLDLPRLLFFAKRDIAAGEELLYDYGDRCRSSLQSHPWLKV